MNKARAVSMIVIQCERDEGEKSPCYAAAAVLEESLTRMVVTNDVELRAVI